MQREAIEIGATGPRSGERGGRRAAQQPRRDPGQRGQASRGRTLVASVVRDASRAVWRGALADTEHGAQRRSCPGDPGALRGGPALDGSGDVDTCRPGRRRTHRGLADSRATGSGAVPRRPARRGPGGGEHRGEKSAAAAGPPRGLEPGRRSRACSDGCWWRRDVPTRPRRRWLRRSTTSSAMSRSTSGARRPPASSAGRACSSAGGPRTGNDSANVCRSIGPGPWPIERPWRPSKSSSPNRSCAGD